MLVFHQYTSRISSAESLCWLPVSVCPGTNSVCHDAQSEREHSHKCWLTLDTLPYPHTLREEILPEISHRVTCSCQCETISVWSLVFFRLLLLLSTHFSIHVGLSVSWIQTGLKKTQGAPHLTPVFTRGKQEMMLSFPYERQVLDPVRLEVNIAMTSVKAFLLYLFHFLKNSGKTSAQLVLCRTTTGDLLFSYKTYFNREFHGKFFCLTNG